MFRKHPHITIFLLVIIATILSVNACGDRTINPFEDEIGVYSIYGALAVNRVPNIIRVRKLDVQFQADASAGLDGTVTFTDLSTGTNTILQDTIVNFAGNHTHNFILENQLEPDSQYKITVERSDGVSVSSIATSPKVTEIKLTPDEFIFCETAIVFEFFNVPKPEYIELEVGVIYNDEEHWDLVRIVGDIQHREDKDEMFVILSPRNLLVEIFTPILPDDPWFDPYLLFPTVGCHELDSPIFTIRYTHFGPEWVTGRPFKGPVDIESGDVENGLGFFGAYHTGTFSFTMMEDEEEI